MCSKTSAIKKSDKSMKPIIAFLCAILVISTAKADAALVMPTPQQVRVLACSSPYVEFQITGVTTTDGKIGILFEQTKCTQHTGKGGGTTAFHSSCSYVTWNVDGTISDIDVLSTSISRLSLSLTGCLAQTSP